MLKLQLHNMQIFSKSNACTLNCPNHRPFCPDNISVRLFNFSDINWELSKRYCIYGKKNFPVRSIKKHSQTNKIHAMKVILSLLCRLKLQSPACQLFLMAILGYLPLPWCMLPFGKFKTNPSDFNPSPRLILSWFYCKVLATSVKHKI